MRCDRSNSLLGWLAAAGRGATAPLSTSQTPPTARERRRGPRPRHGRRNGTAPRSARRTAPSGDRPELLLHQGCCCAPGEGAKDRRAQGKFVATKRRAGKAMHMSRARRASAAKALLLAAAALVSQTRSAHHTRAHMSLIAHLLATRMAAAAAAAAAAARPSSPPCYRHR